METKNLPLWLVQDGINNVTLKMRRAGWADVSELKVSVNALILGLGAPMRRSLIAGGVPGWRAR
ncbi:MAG: hypothetical protein ACKONH_05140, partial [Planctomycetia bacterium]